MSRRFHLILWTALDLDFVGVVVVVVVVAVVAVVSALCPAVQYLFRGALLHFTAMLNSNQADPMTTTTTFKSLLHKVSLAIVRPRTLCG